MLWIIVIATTIVSAISLIAILFIFNVTSRLQNNLKPLISLAAGALLAVAFLDLLPEAIHEAEGIFEPNVILGTVLLSILGFFLFERVVHYHHCNDEHHDHEKKHHVAVMNLFGDALHNLIDGFLIASAFLLDFKAGVVVTIAVILHEIPQEIFDFSILLHSGFSKTKAILFNLLVALTAVFGAVVFYFFGAKFASLIPLMAAVAAGNFIYLATADLIPELHNEKNPNKVITHTLWVLVGVAIVYGMSQILPHV